jgi:predicted ester cyclase
MVKHEKRIDIHRPIGEVFESIRYRKNSVDWQPGLVEGRRITGGPLRVGNIYCSGRKFLGWKMEVSNEFVGYEPDKQVVFTGSLGPMVSAEIARPIKRILEKSFNQGNLVPLSDLDAPDYATHPEKKGVMRRSQGLEWLVIPTRTAFLDIHWMVLDEIREAGKYAAKWTVSGTQKRLFPGDQPTGKPIKTPGVSFARIINNRILQGWTRVYLMDVLQQPGNIPQLKG